MAAPIVGTTKVPRFDDAAKAVELTLADADISYLEKLYKPHKIVGASA